MKFNVIIRASRVMFKLKLSEKITNNKGAKLLTIALTIAAILHANFVCLYVNFINSSKVSKILEAVVVAPNVFNQTISAPL